MGRLRLDLTDYTTEIAAPVEQVFTFFKRVDAWPQWASGIKRAWVRTTDRDWGVGFQLVFVPRFFPIHAPPEVLAYEENALIAWGLRTQLSTMMHTFQFEPLGPGRCRVHHTEFAEGLIAVLSWPLRKQITAFNRQWADDLCAAFG